MLQTIDHNNSLVHLAGPENLSRNKVADIFGPALGMEPKVQRMPVSLLKILRLVINLFHSGIAGTMHLALVTENTHESLPPTNFMAQFGLKPAYMEDFIKDFVAKKTA